MHVNYLPLLWKFKTKENIMSFTTNNYEIDFLNVNDADAILIRCYDGETPYIILIDAGNLSSSEIIKRKLKSVYKNMYIDLAICTHPDKDHIGGFFGLLDDDEITINEFWLIDPAEYLDVDDIKHYRSKENAVTAVRKVFEKPNDPTQNLIDLLESKPTITYSVCAGNYHETIPIKVVAPSGKYYSEIVKEMVKDYGVKPYGESDTEKYDEDALPDEADIKSTVLDMDDDPSSFNASSIVLLFTPGDGKKFLFAGDANCASLYKMTEDYKLEVENVTILKVPHHGSKHNMTTEIIDRLSPKISIISAIGSKKHPNNTLVSWLSKKGDVYSTHKSNEGLCYRVGLTKRPNSNDAIPLKKKS